MACFATINFLLVVWATPSPLAACNTQLHTHQPGSDELLSLLRALAFAKQPVL